MSAANYWKMKKRPWYVDGTEKLQRTIKVEAKWQWNDKWSTDVSNDAVQTIYDRESNTRASGKDVKIKRWNMLFVNFRDQLFTTAEYVNKYDY